MKNFTYQKVIYNGVSGWFAICRKNGLYLGMQFGRTKKDARLAFENFDEVTQ